MQNAIHATTQHLPVRAPFEPGSGEVRTLIHEIKNALPSGSEVFLMPVGTSVTPERMGLAVLFDGDGAFGVLQRLGFHITGPLANGCFLACALLNPD